MSQWIESHTALPRHRKTRRLKRLLDCKTVEAIGYLHMLWYYGADFTPGGFLADSTIEDVADACEWPGEPEPFITALTTAGWLDVCDGGYQIHDWGDYCRLYRARQKAAERQRAKRERDRYPQDGNSAVTVTSRDSHAPKDKTDKTDKTGGEEGARARAVDNSNGQPARPTATLLEFTVGELPASNSTLADYARTLARHESRLPRWHIERIVCELAEWRPKKPPANLHLTLNKWLAKEKPTVDTQEQQHTADPELVRPDMVETFTHMVTDDGARLEDLRRSCVSEREYEAVAARVAGMVAGSEGVHW